MVLAVVALAYLAVKRVLATPFGSVLSAIRDNASRVPYLGYDPFWYKLFAYLLAAEVAAIGGLFYPLLRGFVGPDLFGFEVSTQAVVMALVGGVGTLIGPLVGGVVITFLQSVLGSFTERHLFVLGIIFILFVRFLPGGLFSLLRGAGRPGARAMIAVRALSKSFGGLRAVSDLDLPRRKDGVTSIIGPNGAGKSTVFNLIAGTLRRMPGGWNWPAATSPAAAAMRWRGWGSRARSRSPTCFSASPRSRTCGSPARRTSCAAASWRASTATALLRAPARCSPSSASPISRTSRREPVARRPAAAGDRGLHGA